jgi:hypothetical protein
MNNELMIQPSPYLATKKEKKKDSTITIVYPYIYLPDGKVEQDVKEFEA